MNEFKITNLGNNPKGLQFQWSRDIFRYLGGKCKSYLGTQGFNSQNWCDILPAGTSIPPLPTKPDMPESANKLAVALYNQRSKTWETFCKDVEDIRNVLEPSLGDVVTMELTDPIQHMYGLSKLTEQSIIQHVIRNHSQMQTNDIHALDQLCSRPCSDPTQFAAHVANRDANFKRLAQSGVPRCDYDKMATLIKTVNHMPEVLNAVNHYKDITQPDASKQSYKEMTQTISARLLMVSPRHTSDTHSAAAAATSTATDHAALLKEINILKQQIAGLTLPRSLLYRLQFPAIFLSNPKSY